MSFITGGSGGASVAQVTAIVAAAVAPLATTAQLAPLATTAQLATNVRAVKSVQQIDITVTLDGTTGTKSNTQTVTAVDTAKSVIEWQNFRTSVGTGNTVPTLEITNSTTITARVENGNSASGGVQVFGRLLEFF